MRNDIDCLCLLSILHDTFVTNQLMLSCFDLDLIKKRNMMNIIIMELDCVCPLIAGWPQTLKTCNTQGFL